MEWNGQKAGVVANVYTVEESEYTAFMRECGRGGEKGRLWDSLSIVELGRIVEVQ